MEMKQTTLTNEQVRQLDRLDVEIKAAYNTLKARKNRLDQYDYERKEFYSSKIEATTESGDKPMTQYYKNKQAESERNYNSYKSEVTQAENQVKSLVSQYERITGRKYPNYIEYQNILRM